MLTRALAFLAAMVWLTPAGLSQEADYGLTVPVTASVGAMDSQRLQLANPSNSQAAAGLRLMLYPTLKLGKHWFAYGAFQVLDRPYYYYDAFLPARGLATTLIQGYAGYTVHAGSSTLVIKAGKLVSAFGSFPLRYDDMDNPLLDQPLSYIQRSPLPVNQLLCGTNDLLWQHYGSAAAGCGGAPGAASVLTPATLYGLPGVQAEISMRQFDARVQVTSGSPTNPQGWGNAGQYAQWAAGAGYTIQQGFRVGASAFSGPYLDPVVAGVLPAGTTVRNFPASGIGLDGQWARGRFSVYGELQHFQFDLPTFVVAPSITTGYVEAKTVLTPRVYVAGRVGWLQTGHVTDTQGVTASQFAPLLKSYEAASGFWLNRRQLLKVSYSWLQIDGLSGSRFNVYGFELVTHLTPPALTFR